MKLYIMRHGQAQPVAKTDQERRLTEAGIAQSNFVANWLMKDLPRCDIDFVSPYLRAQETYQCVIKHLEPASICLTLDELTPETDPSACGDSLLAYCAQHKANSALVVSHLPLVGLLIADLCPGVVIRSFTTSSVAGLEIDLEQWTGKLLWHKSYAQLAQHV